MNAFLQRRWKLVQTVRLNQSINQSFYLKTQAASDNDITLYKGAEKRYQWYTSLNQHAQTPVSRSGTDLLLLCSCCYSSCWGDLFKQESLANAKISARQPWYIGRNSLNGPHLETPSNINVMYTLLEKYSVQQFRCWQCGSIDMACLEGING